jgi:hypothetical protein
MFIYKFLFWVTSECECQNIMKQLQNNKKNCYTCVIALTEDKNDEQ